MSVTPSSTVVGIFRDRTMAEQAIEALYDAGFHREQIRYSMPDSAGGFFADLKNMFMGTTPSDTDGDHLANDLSDIGLSDEEAQYYTNEYNNGNTILTVQAADREQEALSILHQHGAYNARVSPGSFSRTTDDRQQSSHDHQQDNYPASEQGTDIEDWETQRLPRTVEEHSTNSEQYDRAYVEHEQVYQASPSEPVEDHLETHPSQATDVTTGHDANYQEAQQATATPSEHDADFQEARSNGSMPEHDADYATVQSGVVAPEHNPAYQVSQANGTASEHGDEFQRLQEQIRVLQQQLEDARNQLRGAKEHETHLQTMREREQQLQASRQQVQDLQAELEATLAELRETQARIGQYQSATG